MTTGFTTKSDPLVNYPTLPETNSLPMLSNDWTMRFPFGIAYFQGLLLLVSGIVTVPPTHSQFDGRLPILPVEKYRSILHIALHHQLTLGAITVFLAATRFIPGTMCCLCWWWLLQPKLVESEPFCLKRIWAGSSKLGIGTRWPVCWSFLWK